MTDVDASNLANKLASPPLTQSDAIASLLCLSFASGGLAPANLTDDSNTPESDTVKSEPPSQQAPVIPTPSTSVPLSSSLSTGGKYHRRLSSAGKTRRRLSDAREAANRPSPSLLQSSAAALSLASLSLSSSPPSAYPAQLSTSFAGASRTLAPAPPKGVNNLVTPSVGAVNGISQNDGITVSSQHQPSSIPVTTDSGNEERAGTTPIPISSNGRSGKKRGMDHKCESCSKIYRHPSCLIKHRWEHTPHWREASKFVLSKHQQVQLLEAAAILSHMSPAASGGRSLPDDRSLWPSFLSGGSLPPPESPIPTNRTASSTSDTSAPRQSTATNGIPISSSVDAAGNLLTSPSSSYLTHPVSSSVPARSISTGPRLHDYGVSSGVVTQVRPGLIGVTTSSGGVVVIGDRANASANSTATNGVTPTTTSTQPVPVPTAQNEAPHSHYHDPFGSLGSTGSVGYYSRSSYQHASSIGAGGESWSSYGYGSYHHSPPHPGYPYGAAGVSLPRSSVRSGSSPSRSVSLSHSRSRSGSVEDEDVSRKRRQTGSSDSPASDDESVDVDVDVEGMDEDQEEESRGAVAVAKGYGAVHNAGLVGPRDHYMRRGPYDPYTGRYATGYGRNGFHAGGRPPIRTIDDDDDAMEPGFSVREEEEDMDDMDVVGRMRKTAPVVRTEDQWDGMEMEMDMD